MADADEIKDAIKQNATGPKSASGDSGSSMEQHSIKDQIEAARFIANETAKKNPFSALKYAQDGRH